jgi:hypothetical protein
MTLHEDPDVEQGTPEWDELRCGIVTASVVGQLVTPSTIKAASNAETRALTALLAAERITGWTDPTYVGADMERGWDDEPRAIEAYEKHTGVTVDSLGFMVRDDWGFRIGYSPDGLVNKDGCVEVKSRRPKKHLQTIIADKVPAENMAQIQAGLLVSGRDWCDYISYCGGMRPWVKRVEPDERWQSAIVTAAQATEDAIATMTATYHKAVTTLPDTERSPDYSTVELKLT